MNAAVNAANLGRDAPLLAVNKVRKSFGARRVLQNVTFEAWAGEVIAVTGANGSGKSTLLKIIAGLARASSGAVTVKGATDGAVRRASVAYAGPDIAFYPELSGQENIMFFARASGEVSLDVAATDALLASVGLAGRGNDAVGAYSSGMRQRLRLAFAQMRTGASLLLLDEPSLALDETGVPLIAAMVRAHVARGGVALLATNDAREAALGDRTLALGA